MGLLDTLFTYDTAVYWAPETCANSFGRVTYEEPIEIEARWSTSDKKVMDQNGNEVNATAKAYVDRDLSILGKLKHGELDSTTPDDPSDDDDAYQIIQVDKLPNIRHTKYLRTVYV